MSSARGKRVRPKIAAAQSFFTVPIPLPTRASPPTPPGFHFEPVGRAPRAVGRILALRHDTFEPHLAGMGEDGRAVAFDMLVEPDTGTGLGPG